MTVEGFRFCVDSFAADLAVNPPSLFPDAPARQLQSIAALLQALACNLCVVESEYIDRDYMEDHSAFYARCVKPPANKCRRVNFFRLDSPDTFAGRELLRRHIVDIKQAVDDRHGNYLGYCVLRPLSSAPVGRTAITPKDPSHHPCLRAYNAHLLGVEWTVRSLVFQQQDRAVSACATAALWSSLSQLESMERMAGFSPAAITTMAASSYGAGRVFPSDGLSIEQICRVIHLVGASPVVITCEADLHNFLAFCAGALQSSLAPLLLISNSSGDDDEIWHAVTAVGLRTAQLKTPDLPETAAPTVFDESHAVRRLYVHDDRLGPFIPARIAERTGEENANGGCLLDFGNGEAPWWVRNIVVPMYHKIRFSLPELLATEATLCKRIKLDRPINGVTIRRRRMIQQLTTYAAEMMEEKCDIGDYGAFSRYVGIVRLRILDDRTDIVFDTTAPPGDPRAIALIGWGKINLHGKKLRAWLRTVLPNVSLITPS